MDKLLSLCIPTYGVVEWVIPVIDSIYAQNVSEDLYEVVVTDNGNNKEFEQIMTTYIEKHKNFVYKKTNSHSFLNEIDAYKTATGVFIKFINHRTILKEGGVKKYLNFIEENIDYKPCVYFSNGKLKLKDKLTLSSFDEYVKTLSYWSSWSTGMGFWKEDFEKIDPDQKFNELFPHTNILFSERKKNKYIIIDDYMLEELPQNNKPKGNYDLYYAFGIEYVGILLDLLRDKSISVGTFNHVKEMNSYFIASLYYEYNIRKHYSSYDISSFESSISVNYNIKDIKKKSNKILRRKILKKLFCNFNRSR